MAQHNSKLGPLNVLYSFEDQMLQYLDGDCVLKYAAIEASSMEQTFSTQRFAWLGIRSRARTKSFLAEFVLLRLGPAYANVRRTIANLNISITYLRHLY
jgi:hypothetical protein